MIRNAGRAGRKAGAITGAVQGATAAGIAGYGVHKLMKNPTLRRAVEGELGKAGAKAAYTTVGKAAIPLAGLAVATRAISGAKSGEASALKHTSERIHNAKKSK